MCDTQVIRRGGATLFAKNSDREPDEPQLVRQFPAVRGDPARHVRTTYLEVEQVPDRHAVILSQPAWMWGAEMGVNEHGLAIGNEAVFTRVVQTAGEALLGMDLLRLALERCRTAREAIDCIDRLLGRHGQAGPAGYRDKGFRYDSSFILADPGEAWVLETAGRHWVARRVRHFEAISNTLCIADDFDLHSDGLHAYASKHGRYNGRGKLDFARAFDTRFMRTLGRARQRRACSLRSLAALDAPDLPDLASSLRRHASDAAEFARHGNGDLCMHAGGLLRPSQTTGSMLVRSSREQPPEVFVTGTSAPCLGLFQPVSFDDTEAAAPLDPAGTAGRPGDLWHHFEPVHHRALFDAAFRARLRASRDALEPTMFDASLGTVERRLRASEWHRQWRDEACRSPRPGYRWHSPYARFWRRRAQTAS